MDYNEKYVQIIEMKSMAEVENMSTNILHGQLRERKLLCVDII